MNRQELLEEYPNLKEFLPFLDLLNEESHRGKVLISSGFLEQQLRNVLLAFMIENATAKELLDAGNAPLGTFSSRIAACYALGLISDEEYADLTLIRKIRNDFAHDIHTTFETQSVVDRCKRLSSKAPSVKIGEDYDPIAAAHQFGTAAVSLIMNLINRPHYVAEIRRSFVQFKY